MQNDDQFFNIRAGQLADLDPCLRLDSDHQSEMVWQMYRSDESLLGVETFFRAVRLPRVAEGSYPREQEELLANLHQQDCFLVATVSEEATSHDEQPLERVIGFTGLHEQRWQHTGWVQNIVVDQAWRRRGVGTALFRAVATWARGERLHRLILEAPTKNGSAISFFHGLGATFCGFNDRYYTNGDIAVFFEYRL